jgi:hypothetical protein
MSPVIRAARRRTWHTSKRTSTVHCKVVGEIPYKPYLLCKDVSVGHLLFHFQGHGTCILNQHVHLTLRLV